MCSISWLMPNRAFGSWAYPSSTVRQAARLSAVAQLGDTFVFCAVVAAEHSPVFFQPVPDNAHVAVFARWGEQVDRALEAVERIGPPALSYFERFIVIVSASVALRHIFS
ncbi:MAG: hypothetical protein ACXW16_03290 [Burkholderiaceae bacterium]